MPEAIVIGAGLTGLAATYQLEQQQVETTLIEVKRRVGGSIRSTRQDGFALDAGPFALDANLAQAHLEPFGLGGSLLRDEGTAHFRHGTQTLVDALDARIASSRLMRMAVSSVGELEGERFGICLENGLLLRAKAVIITVPLRYAERLFYGFITEITERLLALQTQPIQRVSWGFAANALPPLESLLADPAVAFVQRCTVPERVPLGQVIVQVGLRAQESSEALADEVRLRCKLPPPTTQLISGDHEALTLPVDRQVYQQGIAAVRALLPPGMLLVGSDYGLPPQHPGIDDLAARLANGQQAAREIAAFLRD